ncbi:MAG: 30S ribosomal protein S17 [Candidatus Latescibacteria bacterium]|nr:30S ribosomal protein S17 [Candidatus Latescibacterota bacterium]
MSERAKRKIRSGIVTSDMRDKTITVTIERTFRHSLYGRVVKSKKKLIAHDEKNEANNGDLVEVMETRPLSKTKRWRLTNIIERAK